MRSYHLSLIRGSWWVHPRDSRYSVRSFVTQPGLSATWPTIDPTRSWSPSLHFLSSPHRCSLFRLSPRSPFDVLHHDSETCLFCPFAPFVHSIASSLSFPSLLRHFQFWPLHSLLLSLSRSCPTSLFPPNYVYVYVALLLLYLSLSFSIYPLSLHVFFYPSGVVATLFSCHRSFLIASTSSPFCYFVLLRLFFAP